VKHAEVEETMSLDGNRRCEAERPVGFSSWNTGLYVRVTAFERMVCLHGLGATEPNAQSYRSKASYPTNRPASAGAAFC